MQYQIWHVERMSLPSLKRWAGNLLLIFAGLVAGVIILEVGLRLISFSYPNITRPDEYAGYALRPGAEGWYREEGESYIRINSDGLRGGEQTKLKPAGTFRVAVLGDSFAVAVEVPVEKSFPAVMEQALKSCQALGGRQVEVINFGVGGYGTAQELATLRHRVWDYDPDFVVLAVFTANDIHNNSRALEQDPMRPYFIYDHDQLVLDASFLASGEYRARQKGLARLGYQSINYSRILQLANKLKNFFVQYRIAKQIRNFAVADGVTIGPGLVNTIQYYEQPIYLEPRDSVWAEAWRVTEGVIVLMRDEVVAKGADFLVVTLSNPIQAYPDPSVRAEIMASLGVDDLFYPDSRLKALGEREDFAVLNLAPPFQAYADEHQVFLHGFENTALGTGHWNVEGHRLAGQMIAQRVCEQLFDGKTIDE